MGPADPFPPQGTQTPGLPTFHFYFPGCKMPLAIRSGGVLFFSLIFTHKMCISRTKAAMMDPLVLANFLSVLSRNSCAGLFTINTFLLKRHVLYAEADTTMDHVTKWAGGFSWLFFCCLFCNQKYFKDSPLSFSSLLQRITFCPLINYV